MQHALSEDMKRMCGIPLNEDRETDLDELNERGKKFGITTERDGYKYVMNRKDWSKPIVVKLSAEVTHILDAFDTMKRYGISY